MAIIPPALFAEYLWLRKCFVASGRGVMFYDYLLTLEDEVQYMWNAPWNIVKITFLLSRYANILGNAIIGLEEFEIIGHGAPSFCTPFRTFSTLFTIFSVESIHILVIMRAWAIWGCRRVDAFRLGAAYALYWVSLIVILNLGLGKKPYDQGQDVYISGICTGYSPDYLWISYTATFFLDTGMFIVTMRSLYSHSRAQRHLYPSHLLGSLYRDAIAFFIAGIFQDTVALLTFLAFPDDPRNMLPKAFSSPLLSVTGQRLVLNLRGLKTSTFSSADLSGEVARQLDRLAALDAPEQDGGNREYHDVPACAEAIKLGDCEGAGEIELKDIEAEGPTRG
ncbi:hypothetical protein BJ138DRAFT_1130027 [Hygrophoropsis aurantiaca]|uniref:Uncharacterized protein n=1 Tax=Hygrophoropsis aurantiaca TaxID=72124 RepID=A0ACB7ZYW4_9AGAM|nr:hypothetical protein BJ138DRAFT_1130027 [Hygrophoropsis aurantiaca]